MPRAAGCSVTTYLSEPPPPLSSLFRPAVVSAGQLEGVYAWIAANYAAGKLHGGAAGDPLETIGVLEMGGASMQATFVPGNAVPSEFEYRLELAGRRFVLYTHSFLVRRLGAAALLRCDDQTLPCSSCCPLSAWRGGDGSAAQRGADPRCIISCRRGWVWTRPER